MFFHREVIKKKRIRIVEIISLAKRAIPKEIYPAFPFILVDTE
jgi:hypothetical protein